VPTFFPAVVSWTIWTDALDGANVPR
jgi:hypothetical protein